MPLIITLMALIKKGIPSLMSILPIKKSPRTIDINRTSTLIYGIPGIGKSTWCSQIPNILGLLFEPGWNAIDGYSIDIRKWTELQRVYSELDSGGWKNYGGICIDTIDIAYDRVCEHICKKNNVEHQSDMGYGKGWGLIATEFRMMLTNLAQLPIPLFLVSHSKQVQIESRNEKYVQIIPSLSGKPHDIVSGLAEIILYFTIGTMKDGSQVRLIKTSPNKYYESKDRTGILHSILQMEYSAFENCFKKQEKEKE